MKKLLFICLLFFLYAPFAHAALTDNIISYWKLDETTGNANDALGLNTLTNNNTATYSTGKLNNGVSLVSASAQYLSIVDGSQTGLDFSDTLSFSGWVKFTSVAQWTFISKRVGTANQRSYRFSLEGGNTLQLITFTDGSAVGVNVNVAWTPSTATWYYITVTKTDKTVKFYVNGAQQGTTQTGANGTIYNGTAPFELGAFSTDTEYFNGMMDEWGVWNRVLTDAEITTLYNGGDGIQYPFTVPTATTDSGTLTFFGW